MTMHVKNRVIGGVLLVAGTTIGGAVLALPVGTGGAGFWPSTAIFFACWAYLLYTAMLFLEANLWFDEEVNLISMARHTLGGVGRNLAWVAYLLLLYALTTAYVAASGEMSLDLLETFGIHLPEWAGPIPMLLVFGYFLYVGTEQVDIVNRALMIGLAIATAILVVETVPSVELSRIEHAHWGGLSSAASVIVTAFGFHIIIPSLTEYMGHEVKPMRKAILIGSAIPLGLYLLWELLILGIVPLEGPHGLLEANEQGMAVTILLRRYLSDGVTIGYAARIFEACAIITSFLGVSLSLLDFLADGFRASHTRSGRLGLLALTFVPPMIISYFFQRVFFSALEVAGGICIALLLGVLPAAMVWAGRYHHGFTGKFRVPGGKPALLLVMLGAAIILGNEVLKRLVF